MRYEVYKMFCICPRDSRGETDIRESGPLPAQ